MTKLSTCIVFAILVLFSQSVAARRLIDPLPDKSISGKITEGQSGNPVVGVSVILKGTNTGTSTDDQGMFQLTVPDKGAVLVVSSTGFGTQEITVGTETNLTLHMSRTSVGLDEVVVIGYGTQKKKEVTASIASVKSENFVKGAVNDAGQLLQGKVAGLSISTNGGDPVANSQIILRGINSINASSSPLVLIDKIPGNLRTVAPEDIESIDVLKDGAAAAIYGTRGTNGVILITTRKSTGRIQSVEYSGYASTQKIARRPEMFTAPEYRAQKAAGVSFAGSGSKH